MKRRPHVAGVQRFRDLSPVFVEEDVGKRIVAAHGHSRELWMKAPQSEREFVGWLILLGLAVIEGKLQVAERRERLVVTPDEIREEANAKR